jgi:predicted glycoside hydrolase/deacetylase ChbG (UPF0249 family)
MANSQAFNDAVSLARVHPRLSVGCHVMMVDGEPLTKALSLSAAGRFRNGFGDIAKAAISRQLSDVEIEQEAHAQFQKLTAAGIHPTHFDTHKHTHMLPQVLRPILRAAKAAGVRAVRNPFVPLKALTWAHLVRRPKLWSRYGQVKILRGFANAFRREIESHGMRTTDGSFGVIVTGTLDAELFRAIVGSIPEGTWEFVCHPGYNDAELGAVRTRLRESRVKELQVLTSDMAREILAQHNVELISFRDL